MYTIITNENRCGGVTETKPNHDNWTLTSYLGGYEKELWDGEKWIESASIEEIQSTLVLTETYKYIQRTKDGIVAYAKISAEFRLAKLSGTIDDATHTYIENLLIPVRNEVLAGQWISGKQKLIGIGETAVGTDLYNRLMKDLDDYINANY